jgi:glucose-1-phosphatase
VKQPTQPAAESPAEPTKSTESVQAPADKDAADKAAADKATADKAAADKAVADKAAVEKTAADKAADDDKAADKTARRAIPRGRQLAEPPETVPDPTGTNAKLAKNKGSSSVRTAAAREPTSLSTVDAASSDLFHPEPMIP